MRCPLFEVSTTFVSMVTCISEPPFVLAKAIANLPRVKSSVIILKVGFIWSTTNIAPGTSEG